MADPFDACRVAYEQGQRDALSAARDAVTAIESNRDALVWWERFGDNPDNPDEVTVLIELHRAIAAIDAQAIRSARQRP